MHDACLRVKDFAILWATQTLAHLSSLPPWTVCKAGERSKTNIVTSGSKQSDRGRCRLPEFKGRPACIVLLGGECAWLNRWLTPGRWRARHRPLCRREGVGRAGQDGALSLSAHASWQSPVPPRLPPWPWRRSPEIISFGRWGHASSRSWPGSARRTAQPKCLLA